MRVPLRRRMLVPALFVWLIPAIAQTPAHKPVPSTRRYCHPELDFCFRYPALWTTVGEAFNSNGIVIAPPQKQDKSLWDAVTVALVALPPEGDEEQINLNGIIEQASASLRGEEQNFQTLQRQELTVDHKPAQLIRVRYTEKSTSHDWIEELIFIEGPDNEIYSVALKSSPEDFARLEPVFNKILASWTLPQPAPPPEEDSARPPAPKPAPPH